MKRAIVAGALGVLPSVLAAMAFAACSGKTSSVTPADGSLAMVDAHQLVDRIDLGEPYFPDAPCTVEIETPPLLAAQHVPIGTDITWSSNPPSSGPHFPVWAAFQEYTSPVPRGFYLHDEEHGAIVFLYKCAQADGCPDVVAVLRQAVAALPDDPLCLQTDPQVRVRYVLTPDPLLDVPVAAAAWGWTYKAQCADLQTLVSFAREHYGQGPEVACANGTTDFSGP